MDARPPATLDEALAAIRGRREAMRARGIELIGVVGSVARGEDRPDSDVDVAYDVVGRASLLDVARAMLDLESDLGRKVDMVDISHAKPRLRRYFERDLVRA